MNNGILHIITRDDIEEVYLEINRRGKGNEA